MPRVCNSDVVITKAELQHQSLHIDSVVKGKAYDFYFSYDLDVFCDEARQARQRVKFLCDYLGLHSFTIWTSESQIQVHADKYHNITTGLESSTLFVTCLSRKYIDRCCDITKNAKDTSLFEIRYTTDRFRGSRRIVLALDEFSMNRRTWAGLLGGDIEGALLVDFTSDDRVPTAAAALGQALWSSVPSGMRNDFSRLPPAPTSTIALGAAAPRPSFRCAAGDTVQIRTAGNGVFRGRVSEESADGALVVVLVEEPVGAPPPAAHFPSPPDFLLPPPPPPPPFVPSFTPMCNAGPSLHATGLHLSGASPPQLGAGQPPAGGGAAVRLALGQDSSRLARVNGLTAAHFAVGEPVSVRRGDGRRTVGEVEDVTLPGAVKVRCGPEQVKTVPEAELGKLCGNFTF